MVILVLIDRSGRDSGVVAEIIPTIEESVEQDPPTTPLHGRVKRAIEVELRGMRKGREDCAHVGLSHA